jgi:wyosine [tRNA(Phe)-imidazoG37] synthetase (radical SAM superfamily)
LLSRRLGRSLGVNILSTDRKCCSFDCIYCHYGRTHVKTLTPVENLFPSVENIRCAVEKGLRAYPYVDHLTFSGNGEPTLHPHFPHVISEVRRLRDELAPRVRLAIFSNATTASRPEIREALALFDVPMLKLDAGDALTLARINRPVPGVTLAAITQGLRVMPRVVIQSVLIRGRVSNIEDEAFEAWVAALMQIQPHSVQIYSTDYPVPDTGVTRVRRSELRCIAQRVQQRTGLQVKAY